MAFWNGRTNYRAICLACSALATGIFPANAWAQGSDTEGAGGGDIIVTARRVEERLQDVPISITVFSQEDLSKRNVAVASDLATYTPSLSVNQRYGPEKSSFALRGFNQQNNGAPTVGVYFAEVVGVRAQGGTTGGNTVGAGAFTDLSSVQVLKGPQGTLFGRNTTGGAILLTPQKPTGEFEGFVEGTYGNYDQVKLTGAINIPVSDTFRIRVAAERNKRDGYMKNMVASATDDYNDIDYIYGRLSVVADLTPDLENYLIFHYSRSDTHGYGSRIVTCGNDAVPGAPTTNGNDVIIPGNAGYNAVRYLQVLSCRDQVARQNARGDGPYQTESRLPHQYMNIKQWQAINTTTWTASEAVTLKNIMSYGQYREASNFDYTLNNFVVPNYNNLGGFPSPAGTGQIVPAGTPYDRTLNAQATPNTPTVYGYTFTNELQLQGEAADGRLNFVVGGYLEFSRPLGFNTNAGESFLNCTDVQNRICTNPLGIGGFSDPRNKLNFDNHGVYGQGTYNFTDQLALTAGARWTFDKIVGLGQNTRTSLSTAAGSYIDPRTGVSIRRVCSDTVRFPGKVVTSASECTTNITNKSNEPTWTINLDFKPTPDLLLYAKYSRGYRQGGMSFTSPGFETWDPEKMDTYEAGAKATFRGSVSGYLNVAAFYNNLSDLQVFAQLLPTPASRLLGITGGSATVNAGKARSYGVELDGSLRFFDSLRISAGYAYLNTRITEVASPAELAPKLVGTPFESVVPQVSKGTGFADTPKHKLTVSAEYTLPLDESMGDLSIGATWTYTGRYTTNFAEPAFVNGFPIGVTPSSDLLNINVDWKEVAGSPIDLSLFATNVTKELIKLPNQFPWPSTGVGEVSYAPPRMYGARVRFNF